jgi:exoribonuclease-2
MQPSHASGQPGAHAGLGLEVYVQATSPLRRYLDLVVHQQLRAYVRGEEMMDETAVMARVGAAEAVRGDTRWVERQSNLHWKLVYLQQRPDWSGEGVVVESRGKRHLILIPALDMDTRVHRASLSVDESVLVKTTGVDLPTQSSHFRLIE